MILSSHSKIYGSGELNYLPKIIDNLEINDEFETSLEDNDGKKVKFLLVENFDANGNNCKKTSP